MKPKLGRCVSACRVTRKIEHSSLAIDELLMQRTEFSRITDQNLRAVDDREKTGAGGDQCARMNRAQTIERVYYVGAGMN